jgi:TPR repeat protein
LRSLRLAGSAYRDGAGVTKSKAEAKKYLKLAADQGDAEAAKELAKFWF